MGLAGPGEAGSAQIIFPPSRPRYRYKAALPIVGTGQILPQHDTLTTPGMEQNYLSTRDTIECLYIIRADS